MRNREYALYKGEEILCIGTAKEIAERLGIKKDTVMFYGTQEYKRRVARRKESGNARILVRLDDCEEEAE